MNRRKAIAGVLSVLLCLGALWGCGQDAAPKQTSSSTMAQQSQPEPEDYTSITVTTPYGKLYFNEQWATCMRTEQQMLGETLTVTFKGIIGQNAYTLFHVVVGEHDGECVGQLTDDKGTKRNVYIIVDDSEEYLDITAEEQDQLCAMLEDINFVIEKLN